MGRPKGSLNKKTKVRQIKEAENVEEIFLQLAEPEEDETDLRYLVREQLEEWEQELTSQE